MDEREELLKKLNEDFEKKEEADVTPYRATTNFNTSLNNPNMNVNNNLNVNVQSDSELNNSMSVDTLLNSNNQVNTNPVPPQEEVVSNQEIPVVQETPEPNLDVTEKFYEEQPVYDMQTNYTQTYIQNQDPATTKKKFSIKMSKDTQVLLIAILIIFIFIIILPVVSDVVKNIKNN